MNSEQLLEQTHAVDAISRELGFDGSSALATPPTPHKRKDDSTPRVTYVSDRPQKGGLGGGQPRVC